MYQQTLQNVENKAVNQVMKQISTACNNGQFGLKIIPEFSPIEVKAVEETFTKLGYNVIVDRGRYPGTLKERVSIKINWYHD